MSENAPYGEPVKGCPSAWSEDWTCNREAGHQGQHRDKRNGYWFLAPEAPEKPAPRSDRTGATP